MQITERDPKLRSSRAVARNTVSVPFSMGTVLLRPRLHRARAYPACCFSPLLDGDGVASVRRETDRDPQLGYPALSVAARLFAGFLEWCGTWPRPTPRC